MHTRDVPDEDVPPGGYEFMMRATDPDGRPYMVTARRTSGIASPAVLGADNPTSVVAGLLNAVNAVRVRTQRGKSFERAHVYVERMDTSTDDDDELAYIWDGDTMAEARAMAQSLVGEIEAGTFVPRTYS